MVIKKVKNFIFLRDVFLLSFTAFGGPQAHFGTFLNLFVIKRHYLTEEDLIELYALCQILPGPTSTQTITALGYKIGGPNLAYLTTLFWMLPAFCCMTTIALLMIGVNQLDVSLEFLRFVQPITVGIVAFSAFKITKIVVRSKTAILLVIISTAACYLLKSPYAFPVLILFGGLSTAWKYKKQPVIEQKQKFKIEWSNLILWFSVLVFAAILGGVTHFLPIRVFENFYRNGSLIFGGGQVLVPLLYTEFVEYKNYLTSEQFISGFGFAQMLPGPVFAFSAYIGSFSMMNYGTGGQILGAIMATSGIFMPGIFLIFFVIRFWEKLKSYRTVKASLEGINSVSSGMVIAAIFLLSESMQQSWINYLVILMTFFSLIYIKIPIPIMILLGILIGIFF